MIAIFKKEFRSFFYSPLAYIYIAVVTAIIGLFFWLFNIYYGYPYFNYCLGSMIPRLVTVALIPLLTMRIFSEETHTKSDQMLLTAPVKLWEIVLGKFLAVVAVFAIVMLICCLFPLIILWKGEYYYLPTDYLTILIFFLYGCVFIALGVFLSSITEYTAISAVLSFVGVAAFILYSALYSMIPTTSAGQVLVGCLVIIALAAIILYIVTKNAAIAVGFGLVVAVAAIVTNIVSANTLSNIYVAVLEKLNYSYAIEAIVEDSVFSISGIILYLTTTFVFLVLTIQVLHKRRWN